MLEGFDAACKAVVELGFKRQGFNRLRLARPGVVIILDT